MTSTQATISEMHGSVDSVIAPTTVETLTANICGRAGIWKATAAALVASTLGSSFALEHALDINEHTQVPTLSLTSPTLNSGACQQTEPFTFADKEGVATYLASHRGVEAFLCASVPVINRITGGAPLSLDYLLEDGWEQIYLIVNLDEYSYTNIESIEHNLYEEWYLQADEHLTRDLAISFS